MRKLTKLLTMLLAIMLGISVVACGGKPAEDDNGGSGDNGGIKQYFESTSWKPEKLESNGVALSKYQIVVPARTTAKKTDEAKVSAYAAEELQKYIKKATGVELSIVEDTASATEYEILLGKVNRPETSEDSDFNNLGDEAFNVKSIGNKLVVFANQKRGLLYGVYEYLMSLGFRFYSMDYNDNYSSLSYNYDAHSVEKIPDASEVFVAKDADISWAPTITYRDSIFNSAHNPAYAVKNFANGFFGSGALEGDTKYGGTSGYIGGGAYMVHSFFGNGVESRPATFGLLPNQLYAEHPEYFSLVNGVRVYERGQPCITNPDVEEVVYANALRLIASNPNYKVLSVSENDGGTFCQCPTCQASYEKYGISGTYLNFVNKIAERIYNAGYTDVLIETLAYSSNGTRPLPKKDASGEYTVVPRDNVQIRLCLSFCAMHDDCENFMSAKSALEDWSSIAQHLSIYYYAGQWNNFYNVYPNYNAFYDAYNLFSKNKVNGVYNEGYYNESAEFEELKTYLLCKLMKNPGMSREEYLYHMYDFLEGYYGEGWESILYYINYTVNLIDKKAKRLDAPHYYSAINPSSVFDYDSAEPDFVTLLNEKWDDAEFKASNQKLTGKVSTERDRVKKSRIHWSFTYLSGIYGYITKDLMADYSADVEDLYRNIQKYGCYYTGHNAEISHDIQVFVNPPDSWAR